MAFRRAGHPCQTPAWNRMKNEMNLSRAGGGHLLTRVRHSGGRRKPRRPAVARAGARADGPGLGASAWDLTWPPGQRWQHRCCPARSRGGSPRLAGPRERWPRHKQRAGVRAAQAPTSPGGSVQPCSAGAPPATCLVAGEWRGVLASCFLAPSPLSFAHAARASCVISTRDGCARH